MFKNKTTLVLLLLATSIGAFAQSPFQADANTPVQVFSQAGVPDQPVVKAEFAAPQEKAQPKSKQASTKANSSQTPKAESESNPTVSQSSQKELQDQIDTINRTDVIYRQSVDTRIANLDNQIQAMQSHLKNLNQAMLLLNQEVVKLNQQNVHTQQIQNAFEKTDEKNSSGWLASIDKQLGGFGLIGIIVLVILALVIAIWAFYPKKKKNKAIPAKTTLANQAQQDEENDTEGEYDYMGSDESIPAKLNLVRAYIAMEDYIAAKKVIEEVLAHGDETQCEQARSLLSKIPQANAG